MVQIEIDSGSGFCFGVTTAIRKAEEELEKGGILYCLGDIVHNGMECERLKDMGLVTINHDDMRELHDVKVLLRAHGEPPETYELARRNNIEIIDATCPVVLQLQKRIKQQYNANAQSPGQSVKTDAQIVIFGKKGHAEVLGLVGQTDSSATFKSFDTICRSVANRMPNISQFASRHDLILFVCGRKSSNGKVLYNECLRVNPNTHLVEDAHEIEPSWLEGIQSVGICGATSTPRWLMEQCRDAIQQLA